MVSTNLKQFLGYVKPYRGLLVLVLICGIIRYLIPLALPWSLKVVIDDLLTPSSTPRTAQLNFLMATLIGLYGIYAVASYWRSYLAGVAGHRIILDLRQQLYLHLQRMSLSFFDRQRVGGVVSRMTSDIASAQNFVGAAFVNTVMDLACVGTILIILIWMHRGLCLVAVSILPIYAVLSHILNRRIRATSRQVHSQLEEISGELTEQFSGISTIQAYTQEERVSEAFSDRTWRYFTTVIKNVRLQSIALGVTGFLTALGPILVVWYGAFEVWAGRLTIGALTAFYAYLGMLYQPVQRLAELNLVLANSLAAMDRIFEVFATYPEVKEHPHPMSLGRVLGTIAFENVSFQYDGRGPVFTELFLTIPAGTTVALIGPSGSGKSTLAKLLPRFYDVTGGCITIDGIDIRKMSLKSLRQQIAIVTQEPILFSGTIRENLLFGASQATEGDLRRAAQLAHAEEFILSLPAGYETEIGERGVRLSGGQKQRLTLARAFLKDAPILLLDEPTSALDPESEVLIKEALIQLLQGRTALIIAHRLSTIEHVDRVVVLAQGKIIEEGPHEELLNLPGSLYRQYASQQLSLLSTAPA